MERLAQAEGPYLCFFSACSAVFFCSSFSPSSEWSSWEWRSAATYCYPISPDLSSPNSQIEKFRVRKIQWAGTGKRTASSLSLANSGFQWPFPSFCFFNWSCLCFSFCSARSGLSGASAVSNHLEIYAGWGWRMSYSCHSPSKLSHSKYWMSWGKWRNQ